MSVGDIKFFTISQNGFVLSVQAVDMGNGQTQFFIKSSQGQGDLNAIWWSDGDSTVDGSITLSKSDSSLNMNGTGIVWDGYDYLSSAGLGKLGEAKSTFITQGETLTYIANVSLADVSTLGIRATSVNGGDSIKGVDTSADQAFKLPTVSIGDASVTEGGKAQFTVSLSNTYAYDIKVYYGTGDGTATAGSDYTGTGGYVVIPAGQTTATVYVQTLDDYYKEANETFNVTLSTATTNVLGSNINLGFTDNSGVGTIIDDKDTTTITLSAPAAVDEGGSITVTANVDHPPQGDLTITLSNGQTITILSGQTSGQVTFAAPGDDVYKDASTLNLSINSTTGGNYEALVTTATASVAVHDTIDTTAITLDDVSVNEGAGTATITAHVANAVTGSDLVISLDNGASVTIAVGATSGVSTAFAVQGDDPYVDGESYQVGVSGTSGGNFEALDTSDKATVTVHDTIDTTAITLDDVSVNEGAGTATITAHVANAVTGSDLVISLDNGASVTIAVGATSGVSTAFAVQGDDPYVDGESYQVGVSGTSGGNFEALDTSDKATVTVHDTIDTTAITLDDVSVNEGAGTATITAHVANAVTGSDLVISLDNGASVTIAVGATSGVSTAFAVQGDDPYVDGESYQVGVSGTSGGNFEALDTSDKATVTVHDTIDTTAITLDDVSVNEGAGTATITAHVANAVTGSDLVISLDNGASVTIAVGATSGVSTAFAVADNNVYGDSNNYQVGITGTSGGNFEALNTSDTAKVTVNDNDSPPSFSINDVTVSESAGTITFTVTKTGATVLPATVNYQVAPGTASAGSDYSAGPDPLSGMLSFAAGETSKTITLTIVDNAVFEPTEQFTVNLSSPTNATISDTQGVGTITDNDLSDLGGPTGIDFVPTQTGNNALLGHFIELGDPDATDSFTFSYSATSNNALSATNVSVDATGNLTASQSNTSIGDYTLHVTVTDQANNSTSADFHLLVGQNGSSADTLNGGTGSDIAAGFNGGDTLNGGIGRDYLLGGQQDDILSGGGGNDVLLGGGGNDQFRMTAPSLNGTDTILDFAVAGHTIGLQQGASSWNAANTTATAAGAGLSASDYQNRNAITNIAAGDTNKVVEIQTAQTNAQIVNGTAGAANAYVAVFNSDTGKGELWYDNNWSDTTGRVHVATLDDVTSLTQLLGLDNSKFIEWT
ncbi:immunoglobulin-like domain-containing protein [Mesorhizobium sp. M2E.F.Ca.ET.166.01.1.1]|uniref:immunoglobulin-like domain-containing protein n=1 Tax=Mesorhizobium sp. M2E.F.Ca.ET.166.01.1.1 TaxID=2500523 RepID=UPI000FE0F5B1|nr:immunoglobulin-like domain-containing protein [Mesorhizobium sp. M2E.F.Ca.ET.166.01.1.1]TGT77786.1 hypothetical protein EN809_009585 [Mesorhizobium sp. M2E.F.Ca.ET.166.01.1.1]